MWMVCSVKSIVMAWSYLRILDGNETTCIGRQAKLCNHDLQNLSSLNLLETTLMLVF